MTLAFPFGTAHLFAHAKVPFITSILSRTAHPSPAMATGCFSSCCCSLALLLPMLLLLPHPTLLVPTCTAHPAAAAPALSSLPPPLQLLSDHPVDPSSPSPHAVQSNPDTKSSPMLPGGRCLHYSGPTSSVLRCSWWSEQRCNSVTAHAARYIPSSPCY